MELELTGGAAPLAFVQPGHLECLTTPSLTITELNAAVLPRLVAQKDEARMMPLASTLGGSRVVASCHALLSLEIAVSSFVPLTYGGVLPSTASSDAFVEGRRGGELKRFENGGRLSFLPDEETTVLQHGRMMIAFRRD
ncbi:hypothetical protein K0M31_004072 [Melipona bicolor]|uniref:Uncharacterized protein n=1 Tax=Melipona bicolor TaxID=60889 RepID=A0AA40FYX0_9HYME|nr:hypothetical protein K0M31_004072 [Melipona bicolor]